MDPNHLRDAMWMTSPLSCAKVFARREGMTWNNEFHQQIISDAIVAADNGTGKLHLCVSMPPQYGKSELITRRTPEWYLGKYPKRKVGIGGYGATFAEDWGRKIRDDIDKHSELLGFTLKEDSKSASLFHTDQGGEVWTAGIKSGATGRGAHLLIMDDPIKNSGQANSPTYREDLWLEWQRVFASRVQDGGIILVVMTRWHPDDLAGRLLGESKDENGNVYGDPSTWGEIRLPAIWDSPTPITYTFGTLGEPGYAEWTRNQGDVLCPNRFSKESVEERKASVDTNTWLCMYQQQPNSLAKRGLVYYTFDEDIHVGDCARDNNQHFWLSCDFNRTPMSWCYGQYNDSLGPMTFLTNIINTQIEVLDEISIDESNVPEACEAFLTRFVALHAGYKLPIIHLYGDAAGKAESHAGADLSSWTIIKRAFRAHGVQFIDHVPSKDPFIIERVNAVNNALKSANGSVHVKVDPKCKKLIQDFNKVTWRRDSSGQSTGKLDPGPSGAWTHQSDAFGYFAYTKFAIRGRFGDQKQSLPR